MKMGLQFGLEGKACFKREFRWLFVIPGVSADDSPGVNALPPDKAARPNASFKEMEAKHLIEDVYYPAKPEWKPITITLYDLQRKIHPVFFWLSRVYHPEKGRFYPACERNLIRQCYLNMYSGCGDLMEQWTFEDCWPNAINFGTLDMGQAGVMMCEITLRYFRAFTNLKRKKRLPNGEEVLVDEGEVDDTESSLKSSFFF